MIKEELAATINGREVESMIVLTEKYRESYDIIAHVKKMSILQFLRWRREPIAERTSSFINAFGVKTMLVK